MIRVFAPMPTPAPGPSAPASVAGDVYIRHAPWHRAEERILAAALGVASDSLDQPEDATQIHKDTASTIR